MSQDKDLSSAHSLRLYSRLQHAAHVLKKSSDRALLSVSDISTAQSAVLVTIMDCERPSQRVIAQTLGLDEASVTTMISRLMKLGYVDRRRDPEDGRAWLLSLSPAGEEVLQRIAEPFMKINARIDAALKKEGVDQTVAALIALSDEFS